MTARFRFLLLVFLIGAFLASSCTSSGASPPPSGPKPATGPPTNPNPAPAAPLPQPSPPPMPASTPPPTAVPAMANAASSAPPPAAAVPEQPPSSAANRAGRQYLKILGLKQAGASDQALLEQVRADGVNYQLTTDEIRELRGAGVSQEVLEAMLRSGSR